MPVKCPLCHQQIPSEQMVPISDRFVENNPVDHLMNNAEELTKAWQCNTCGEWICNDCVTGIVIQHRTNKINHTNCRRGQGTIKAPTKSTIIETQYKHPWWAFWRWEIF